MEDFKPGELEQQIAKRLITEYQIDELLVESYLSHSEVKAKLNQNIVWSVLMGVEYWANEIAEILKLYLREKEENVKRRIIVKKECLFASIR